MDNLGCILVVQLLDDDGRAEGRVPTRSINDVGAFQCD